eukprot:gene1165-2260_t
MLLPLSLFLVFGGSDSCAGGFAWGSTDFARSGCCGLEFVSLELRPGRLPLSVAWLGLGGGVGDWDATGEGVLRPEGSGASWWGVEIRMVGLRLGCVGSAGLCEGGGVVVKGLCGVLVDVGFDVFAEVSGVDMFGDILEGSKVAEREWRAWWVRV